MSAALLVALLLSQAAETRWQAQERELSECRRAGPGLPPAKRVPLVTRCLDEVERRRRQEAVAEVAVQEEIRRKRQAEALAAGAVEEAKRKEAAAAALEAFQRREAEQQRIAAEEVKRMEQAEATEAKAYEARRRRCGGDFNRVEVGMPFDRVRDCAGPFVLFGQVQLPGGVASGYRAPGGWVHVLHGKVVAWGRSK